jgi:phage tail sheath gpL-like
MSITFNTVPSNAAASAVFVEQEAVNRIGGSPVIPHRILLFGQFNSGVSPTPNVAQLITNESDAWTRYGRGSLLALMYKAAHAAVKGAVPIYAMPLADDGSGVAATGTIAIVGTATASGTLAVYVGGKRIPVTVTTGDTATDVGDATAAAINADLDLPVTAANVTGTVTFTVRWAGAVGDQVQLEINRRVDDATPAGITPTITDIGDVVAGANDPDATTAFAGLGDAWYTDVAYPYQGTAELTIMESAGEDRVAPGVKRFFAGFVGYTGTYADFITALGSRNSQWTTYVPVHGSPTPAFYIGAAAAAMFAAIQQATPGRPAKGQIITGVEAGDTNDQTYSERDTAVKVGGSYTKNLEDGRVVVGDLCTTRTETDGGADTEDWRFTIIIPNLQFKQYAMEQTFLASPFDQGVVLSDSDVGGPTYGIRPKTVKAYAIALVDAWVALGLSTDRDTIVAATSAVINSTNPGRIDLVIGDIATAGLRIVAAKLEWAFLN